MKFNIKQLNELAYSLAKQLAIERDVDRRATLTELYERITRELLNVSASLNN